MSGLLTVVIFLFKYCYTLIRYRKRCVLLATKLKYSVRVVHDGRSSTSGVASPLTSGAGIKGVGDRTLGSFNHIDGGTFRGHVHVTSPLVGPGVDLARLSATSVGSMLSDVDSRTRSSTMPT